MILSSKHDLYLRTSKKRKVHLYGSAGSAKSWAVAHHLILKMLYEVQIRILVVRKTGPALSKSAWLLVQDLLEMYGIEYQINRTERIIAIGSNEMMFVALDDPLKLKSIERINYVWAEEADELTQADYVQLGLRTRGFNSNGPNKLFFTYNPVLRGYNKYLKDICTNPPSDTDVMHFSYKDNPFLDEDYIAEIEGLKGQDGAYWTIYGEGNWATPTNIVYTNWSVIQGEEWPTDVEHIGYGLDFGYNAPTALIEIGLKEMDAYERELLYERKLTNSALIERLEQLIPDKRRVIIADCAAPERIEEIQKAGFNVWPCSKGPSSIKIGIDRVKRFNVRIHSESTNLIEEKELYKWTEDMEGKPTDVPVNYKNHLMDAERYYLGEMTIDEPEYFIIGNVFGQR